MNFKSSSPGIPFITARHGTHKWFLSSVSELMSLQMAFSYELLATLNTNERPFPCVCTHVCLQVSCFGKLFQTFLEWTQQDFFFIFWSFYFFKLF